MNHHKSEYGGFLNGGTHGDIIHRLQPTQADFWAFSTCCARKTAAARACEQVNFGRVKLRGYPRKYGFIWYSTSILYGTVHLF